MGREEEENGGGLGVIVRSMRKGCVLLLLVGVTFALGEVGGVLLCCSTLLGEGSFLLRSSPAMDFSRIPPKQVT